MSGQREPVRLGRREGVAGTSLTWELRHRGRVLRVDRARLRDGLTRGWLTGIEPVRREDGDWGPLFGRPVYREVFGGSLEPRDHAKARAAARAERLDRRAGILLALAVPCFLGSLPVLTGGLVTQVALLLTGLLGVLAGVSRLLAAVQRRELAELTDQLVPPELPPPEPPVDWAQKAAEDEVEAALRQVAEEAARERA